MSESTKLSRDAYDRLKDEHELLTTEGRVRIAAAIEAARALGDLSENGDYHAAKDEQGKMESRVRQIEAILASAEIAEASGGDRVEHGAVISIRYEGDNDVETYLVGSIEERHHAHEVLSPDSPLGQALLGRKKGETVAYEAPNGELRVTVIDVS